MTPEAAFTLQGDICETLGSPFMSRLLRCLAPRISRGGPVYDRINAWPGDITASGDAVALRVAAGLHRLVLTGSDADLAACYPPHRCDPARLVQLAEIGFSRHAKAFGTWLDQPPQTNEVRRSAVLIALAHWLADHYARPLTISELGASAGLNLWFDRYALNLPGLDSGPSRPVLRLSPDWTGAAPPSTPFEIAARRGVDLNPLNAASDADRSRLLSYIWPDQADRMTMTRAALDHAARRPVAIDRGDAADWLDRRLAPTATGTVHLIFHTIAWQYFPPRVASRARATIEAAGAATTDAAPVAWAGMEPDTRDRPGAGLSLRLWPGDRHFDLGRADFHGRWVDWQPQQV